MGGEFGVRRSPQGAPSTAGLRATPSQESSKPPEPDHKTCKGPLANLMPHKAGKAGSPQDRQVDRGSPTDRPVSPRCWRTLTHD